MNRVLVDFNGKRSASYIKAIRPDGEVIFATAYDRETAISDKMTANETVALPKPDNFDKLY